MKKLLLILSLLVIAPTCFATANFTSGTGKLVIPDVSVDGSTTYDSVTLQLNLANGTFTILEANLKDTKISDTPLDTLEQDGLKIDFLGCSRSDVNQVTCHVDVTNSLSDQVISPDGSCASALFDNLSNEYLGTTVSIMDKVGVGICHGINQTAINGIPIRIRFIYDNINIHADSISAFKPVIVFNNKTIIANFRNIDF